MNNLVKNAINRIYFLKDKEYFVNKCLRILQLPEEFSSLLRSDDIEVIRGKEVNTASEKFYIEYKSFVKGDFKLKYNTVIQISKIVPIYYMQHGFEVDNIDDNRIGSSLDGYDIQPYSKRQFDLHEDIIRILGNAGFTKLTLSEMNEVVEGLKFPQGVTIFGGQITVEQALFNDVFGYCLEDK